MNANRSGPPAADINPLDRLHDLAAEVAAGYRRHEDAKAELEAARRDVLAAVLDELRPVLPAICTTLPDGTVRGVRLPASPPAYLLQDGTWSPSVEAVVRIGVDRVVAALADVCESHARGRRDQHATEIAAQARKLRAVAVLARTARR